MGIIVSCPSRVPLWNDKNVIHQIKILKILKSLLDQILYLHFCSCRNNLSLFVILLTFASHTCSYDAGKITNDFNNSCKFWSFAEVIIQKAPQLCINFNPSKVKSHNRNICRKRKNCFYTFPYFSRKLLKRSL